MADAVAAGDFRDSTDVFAADIRLLRDQRATRAAFLRSLEEAEAEADRDGGPSPDEVMAEIDSITAGLPNAG